MFRHCVMFTWNDQITDEAKASISAGLNRLAELDSVRAYHHGPDAGVSEGNWDYAVVGDFESVDDYMNYADDPGHRSLITEKVAPYVDGRVAVQFEI